jgi:hypothetical protein
LRLTTGRVPGRRMRYAVLELVIAFDREGDERL